MGEAIARSAARADSGRARYKFNSPGSVGQLIRSVARSASRERDSHHGLARTETVGAAYAVPFARICPHRLPYGLHNVVLPNDVDDLLNWRGHYIPVHGPGLVVFQPPSAGMVRVEESRYAQQ